MFLKLTNLFNELKGDPIYINFDHVKSVFERPGENGGFVTHIYSSKEEYWFVEESPSQVYKMLEEKKNEQR